MEPAIFRENIIPEKRKFLMTAFLFQRYRDFFNEIDNLKNPLGTIIERVFLCYFMFDVKLKAKKLCKIYF